MYLNGWYWNLSKRIHIKIFDFYVYKVQVIEVIKPFGYEEIHYFGDKYEEDGNDYHLLNHKDIIPHRVNNLEDTMRELNLLYNIKS